ncbi:MAG: branched-chain amino acid ABC transporter substrate-binding protein [Deltaproteobacteria bacterium]|nr:branched-chain amino acid ABC transporter substrate-binding protein [Deltaproteobacteria bacterium]
MSKKVWLILLSAMLLGGCGGEKNNVVKLAVVSPLTGDVAAMGQGMKRGVDMAVDEANAAKVLGDKTIVMEAFDDRADPKEAVNAANRIISDRRILGVIGHLNSGCSIPASQIYAKRNLVMISPASTNPKLTLQGLKNVFRVCTTDDVQGSQAADFAVQTLNAKRMAVIHDKTAYGQGLAENFQKRAQELQAEVTGFDGIDIGDKDFKALLTAIKTKQPELIYFGGMYTEGGLLTKQAKELGLNMPLLAGDGSYTPEYIKIGGKSSEGDYVTTMGVNPEDLPLAKGFLERFKVRYPGVDMQPYDLYSYEAANLLIAALAEAKLDPTKIPATVAGINYAGILGTTKFDQNGDTLNKTISIYQVKDGKYAFVK